MQVNSALEELSSSVKEVCEFHDEKDVERGQNAPAFLSTISQDEYHKSEDVYLAELTAYTKKQFQVCLHVHLQWVFEMES